MKLRRETSTETAARFLALRDEQPLQPERPTRRPRLPAPRGPSRRNPTPAAVAADLAAADPGDQPIAITPVFLRVHGACWRDDQIADWFARHARSGVATMRQLATACDVEPDHKLWVLARLLATGIPGDAWAAPRWAIDCARHVTTDSDARAFIERVAALRFLPDCARDQAAVALRDEGWRRYHELGELGASRISARDAPAFRPARAAADAAAAGYAARGRAAARAAYNARARAPAAAVEWRWQIARAVQILESAS